MGIPPPPSSPHLYPQSIQIKLYQAFIFSIPILFSIILFLLFYLFYLKRRASSSSSPQPSLPITSSDQSLFASSHEMGLKGNLKVKLPIILFNEDLRTRDSMCSVCLGEFEIKEELHQIPECKHVFHVNCIGHWIYSSPTCPLCRCTIVAATTTPKPGHSHPPVGVITNPQIVSPVQQEQAPVRVNIDMESNLREHYMVPIDV